MLADSLRDGLRVHWPHSPPDLAARGRNDDVLAASVGLATAPFYVALLFQPNYLLSAGPYFCGSQFSLVDDRRWIIRRPQSLRGEPRRLCFIRLAYADAHHGVGSRDECCGRTNLIDGDAGNEGVKIGQV